MKKGQATFEFLVNYGWAILVVLAAIIALIYFGVFNTEDVPICKYIYTAPTLNGDYCGKYVAYDSGNLLTDCGSGNKYMNVQNIIAKKDGCEENERTDVSIKTNAL